MRQRLRNLHRDGHTFVWCAEIGHVAGSGDCHRVIRVRVWRDGKTSRPLQADLLSLSWGTPWSACATDGAYPTSSHIRALVECGLRHGWDPAVRGGTYHLPESAGLALDGFLLTDRLRSAAAADPTARVAAAHADR